MSLSITRFALLRHGMPVNSERPNHWDLLLEREEACATWALEELPKDGQDAVPATRLPDHRKHYLDYEGPVSGDGSNDRGTVTQVSAGECEWLEFSDARVRVRLSSELECSEWLLELIAEDQWCAAARGEPVE